MSDKAATYKSFAKAFADEDRGGRFKALNKTTVMSCWARPPRITLCGASNTAAFAAIRSGCREAKAMSNARLYWAACRFGEIMKAAYSQRSLCSF